MDLQIYSSNSSLAMPAVINETAVANKMTISIPVEIIPPVSPNDYNLLAWWRASDIVANNGETMTGSRMWFDVIGARTASNSSTDGPFYSSSYIGGQPGVVFSSKKLDISPTINLSAAGSIFTMAIVCIAGQDGNILGNTGANIQVRKYRSAANNISMYNGLHEPLSTTLSSSQFQPVVCWYQRNSSLQSVFSENKYQRGTPFTFNPLGELNVMGRTSYGGSLVGGVSEICVWTGSFTTIEITNLFDNYFKPRYPNVFWTSSV